MRRMEQFFNTDFDIHRCRIGDGTWGRIRHMRNAPPLLLVCLAGAWLVSACANTVTKPVSIGNDTYIMTAHGNPSPFGISSAVDMGKLIESGSASCTEKGLRFVLLERRENSGNTFKLGDGSITFKCEK